MAWKDAEWVRIMGHGLLVPQAFELTDGVWISPEVPDLDYFGLERCEDIKERAAVTTMHEIATFSIEVRDSRGGRELANKAWNRLWDFHLLSLASRSPCFILYSSSENTKATVYAVANRNMIINPLASDQILDAMGLEWARANEEKFRGLVKNNQFSSAMRYFGN